MAWFKKKGVDVIDLSEMQRKGIIRRAREKERFNAREKDFVDLRNIGDSSNSGGASSGASALGFLDSLAGASSSGSENSGESITEKLRVARRGSADLDSLKVKIDDLEYKLDRLIERLQILESKFPSTSSNQH